MIEQIELGDTSVDVEFKNIKNIHLSVHPPTGRVRIAAPGWMNLETVRLYAISKIDWIKKNQRKFQEQERETPREYLDIESHYLWGKRYLLRVNEADNAPSVDLKHNQILLTVRPKSNLDKKEAVLSAWYRDELRKKATPIIAKWELSLGVKVKRCFIQRMKTKWGSCNPQSGNIRLNTELAKKPIECLEYIILHEVVHLLEHHHNEKFTTLLDQYMPNWKQYREELNRTPLAHVEWEY